MAIEPDAPRGRACNDDDECDGNGRHKQEPADQGDDEREDDRHCPTRAEERRARPGEACVGGHESSIETAS